jgi:hypothetical protein
MSKLPFIVEPRLKPIIEKIGSEDAGYIEIERRGYLTTGEKNFVQQVQQQDTGTLKLISLSRQIAAKKNISLEKAYEGLIEAMGGSNKTKLVQEIQVEYADEVQIVLSSLANVRLREGLLHAACLVMHRIDSSLTMEDVIELHPDIIEGLALLYADEEAKSTERLLNKEETELQDASDKIEEVTVIDVNELEKK